MTSESPKNSYIDDITLQLISNKSQYNKYLNISNPERNNELQEYYQSVKTHKNDILNILKHYMENPEQQISVDMNNALENFVRSCLKHFELKQAENSNAFYKNSDSRTNDHMKYNNDEDDEDMLFGQIDDNEQTKSQTFHSFWGHAVNKM